jgi:hypothetical protein
MFLSPFSSLSESPKCHETLAPVADFVVSATPDWISCVTFDGDANSIARVSFDNSEKGPDNELALLRTLDALARANMAIGCLQKNGLCCDSFTILRQVYSQGNEVCIELYPVEFSLVEKLQSALKTWLEDRESINHLQHVTMIANQVLSIVLTDATMKGDTPDMLNSCALAAQVLTLGILSYDQAYTGRIHPEFLVDPLSVIHLQGSMTGTDSAPVVIKLLDFTCLKGMVQDSVLVFCARDHGVNTEDDTPASFNLLATPEDLADTWSPTRFVTETTAMDNSPNIYAVCQSTLRFFSTNGFKPWGANCGKMYRRLLITTVLD